MSIDSVDVRTLTTALLSVTAYNQAASARCGTTLTGVNLGGMKLIPGVYCFTTAAQLTGTRKLDAQGNANAQWIFQMAQR
jgi:Ice-binding-like